jgi:hypothetical protein
MSFNPIVGFTSFKVFHNEYTIQEKDPKDSDENHKG